MTDALFAVNARLHDDGFFDRTRALLGDAALARFACLRVLVVGVGGVGGWCAEALVRSGVGHLELVDDDVVAPSNVNRQLPATSETIGLAKTELLSARFHAINPAAKIISHIMRYTPENAAAFDLASFDCVVDAIDSIACKAALLHNALCADTCKVYSSMGAAGRVDPAHVRLSPFKRVTGDGLARALRNRFKKAYNAVPMRDFTCVWSDEQPVCAAMGTRGSFMPVTAAFGLHLAGALLRDAAAEAEIS